MAPHHPSWRLGALRPLALAAGSAFTLIACQSQDLQEGLQPPNLQPSADSALHADNITPAHELIQGLTLSPTSAQLAPGDTITFKALGWLASGPPAISASVTWSATGGTISTGGTYRAGSTPGTFYVKAKSTTTWNEETAVVTIAGSGVTRLTLSPGSATVKPGATVQFKAAATLSNGTTQTNPPVYWSATGGTITQTGLYTAGKYQGTYRVIAAATDGKRDTSAVIVSTGTTSATITGITLSPATASVSTGGTAQFTATATLSTGGTQAASVNWSATGGTISSTGLYTAGTTAGAYRVIAVQQGGTLADTVPVTVTTSSTGGTSTGLYPNRPAAYTRSTAIDFSQAIPSLPDNVDRPISGAPGWYMIYFGSSWSQMSDPSATQSAPAVWKGYWPAGSYGGGVLGQGSGHGIGNIFNYDAKGSNRLYLSMRVYFDFDATQWHPISNKFVNIETNAGLILVQLKEGANWRHAEELATGGNFYIDNNSPSSATELVLPGQVSNIPVPNRKWTQIEVVIDLSARIFKVWQDGVLTTNASNVPFKATSITTVAWNAFRGGGGETLTAPLAYRYDHFMFAW